MKILFVNIPFSFLSFWTNFFGANTPVFLRCPWMDENKSPKHISKLSSSCNDIVKFYCITIRCCIYRKKKKIHKYYCLSLLNNTCFLIILRCKHINILQLSCAVWHNTLIAGLWMENRNTMLAIQSYSSMYFQTNMNMLSKKIMIISIHSQNQSTVHSQEHWLPGPSQAWIQWCPSLQYCGDYIIGILYRDQYSCLIFGLFELFSIIAGL